MKSLPAISLATSPSTILRKRTRQTPSCRAGWHRRADVDALGHAELVRIGIWKVDGPMQISIPAPAPPTPPLEPRPLRHARPQVPRHGAPSDSPRPRRPRCSPERDPPRPTAGTRTTPMPHPDDFQWPVILALLWAVRFNRVSPDGLSSPERPPPAIPQ